MMDTECPKMVGKVKSPCKTYGSSYLDPFLHTMNKLFPVNALAFFICEKIGFSWKYFFVLTVNVKSCKAIFYLGYCTYFFVATFLADLIFLKRVLWEREEALETGYGVWSKIMWLFLAGCVFHPVIYQQLYESVQYRV